MTKLTAAVERLPQVSGSGAGQMYLSRELEQALNEAEKIAIVTKFYQQFGADKACENAIGERYQQALNHLERITGHKNDKKPLAELAAKLMGRNL